MVHGVRFVEVSVPKPGRGSGEPGDESRMTRLGVYLGSVLNPSDKVQVDFHTYWRQFGWFTNLWLEFPPSHNRYGKFLHSRGGKRETGQNLTPYYRLIVHGLGRSEDGWLKGSQRILQVLTWVGVRDGVPSTRTRLETLPRKRTPHITHFFGPYHPVPLTKLRVRQAVKRVLRTVPTSTDGRTRVPSVLIVVQSH